MLAMSKVAAVISLLFPICADTKRSTRAKKKPDLARTRSKSLS
jgi:hypothetical protein